MYHTATDPEFKYRGTEIDALGEMGCQHLLVN